MPTQTLEPTASTERQLTAIAWQPPQRAAHWLPRVYAAAIDALIVLGLALPTLAILVATGAVNPPRYNGELSTQFMLTALFVTSLFLLVYPALWLTRHDGSTIGKRAMGMRVVRLNGEPVSLGRAAFREIVAKQLLFGIAASLTFGTIQVANVLWPFVDTRQRTLHDIVSGTRVVERGEDVDAELQALSQNDAA